MATAAAVTSVGPAAAADPRRGTTAAAGPGVANSYHISQQVHPIPSPGLVDKPGTKTSAAAESRDKTSADELCATYPSTSACACETCPQEPVIEAEPGIAQP